jgi:hypothetical protein
MAYPPTNASSWNLLGLPPFTSPQTPSLAVFKSSLFLAWKTGDWTNRLYVTTSADGVNFKDPALFLDKSSPFGPVLVPFNNQLYMAWTANDASNSIYLASSPDGLDWSISQRLDYTSPMAPSLTVFKNRLFMAWVANDASGAIFYASSPDGVNWSPAGMLFDCFSPVAPTICAASADIHIFGTFGPPGSELFQVVTGHANRPWLSPVTLAATSPHRPGCTISGDEIFLVWAPSDTSKPLSTMKCDNSGNWTAAQSIPGTTGMPPSIAIFKNQVYVAWVTTDLLHSIRVAFTQLP